jgi:hypothetical protein
MKPQQSLVPKLKWWLQQAKEALQDREVPIG